MYYPNLEQVKSLAHKGNLIPISREINADLDTPVSAYLKVARPPYSFLLESVEGGERMARFSFHRHRAAQHHQDGLTDRRKERLTPLNPVEQELSQFKLIEVPGMMRFNGGAVGYLSYESVGYFEELPTPETVIIDVPESVFMLTMTYLVFDHIGHTISVVSHAHLDGDVEAAYKRGDRAHRRPDCAVARAAGHTNTIAKRG